MPLTSSMQSQVGGGGGSAASILIIIQAIDQASKQLQQISKNVSGLGTATKATGTQAGGLGATLGGLGSMALKVGAIIGGTALAFYGFKKAFEASMAIGEEGAAFAQTRISFEQMTTALGVNIEVLDKMRAASSGTISEMSLMSLASTALAGASNKFGLALADALPQIVEIAKAANKANPALGSVDYQLTSLVVGLKRLSPRLIDNTGLQIKLGQAFAESAEEIGKSAEELTSEEQQMALLNATLEAGGRLLSQVGGSAESLTDPFNRLKAAAENLGNVIKAQLAGGFGSWADAIARWLDKARLVISVNSMLIEGLQHHNEETAIAAKTYREYLIEMLRAGVVAGKLTQTMADSALASYDQAQAMEGAAESAAYFELYISELKQRIGLYTEAEQAAIHQEGRWVSSMEQAMAASQELTVDVEALAEKVKAYKAQLSLTSEAMKAQPTIYGQVAEAFRLLGSEVSLANKAVLLSRQGVIAHTLAIGDLTEAERAQLTMEQLRNGVVLEGIEALEGLNQATQKNIGALREAKQAAAEALPTIEAFLDGIDRDLGSPISNFIKDLRFMLEGGGQWAALFGEIQAAVAAGLITPEQAIPLAEQAFVGVQQALVAALLQGAPEARAAIAAALKLTPEQAGAVFANLVEAPAVAKGLMIAIAATWEPSEAQEMLDKILLLPGDQRTIELALKSLVELDDRHQVLNFVEGSDIFAPFVSGIGYEKDIKTLVAVDDPDHVIPFVAGGPYHETVTVDVYTQYHEPQKPTRTPGGTGGGGGAKPEDKYEEEQFGGSVFANQPYLVGEAGVELFVPNRSGIILPNNRLEGAYRTKRGPAPELFAGTEAAPFEQAIIDDWSGAMRNAQRTAAGYRSAVNSLARALYSLPVNIDTTVTVNYDLGAVPKPELPDLIVADNIRRATPRQEGGPAQVNQPYLIGEAGVELFIPRQGGRIVPHDRLEAVRGYQDSEQPTIDFIQEYAADEMMAIETRRLGGQASAKRSYLVGEAGAELFIPRPGGRPDQPDGAARPRPGYETFIRRPYFSGAPDAELPLSEQRPAAGLGRQPENVSNQTLTFNFYDTVIRERADIDTLAYRIADVIARHNRRR